MSETDPAARACQVRLTLLNSNGLHARPAHLFVQTANSFASRLQVGKVTADAAEPSMVDGKSIMGMMMLAAEVGSELQLLSEGPDCEEQIRALRELIENRFGEE